MSVLYALILPLIVLERSRPKFGCQGYGYTTMWFCGLAHPKLGCARGHKGTIVWGFRNLGGWLTVKFTINPPYVSSSFRLYSLPTQTNCWFCLSSTTNDKRTIVGYAWTKSPSLPSSTGFEWAMLPTSACLGFHKTRSQQLSCIVAADHNLLRIWLC